MVRLRYGFIGLINPINLSYPNSPHLIHTIRPHGDTTATASLLYRRRRRCFLAGPPFARDHHFAEAAAGTCGSCLAGPGASSLPGRLWPWDPDGGWTHQPRSPFPILAHFYSRALLPTIRPLYSSGRDHSGSNFGNLHSTVPGLIPKPLGLLERIKKWWTPRPHIVLVVG